MLLTTLAFYDKCMHKFKGKLNTHQVEVPALMKQINVLTNLWQGMVGR